MSDALSLGVVVWGLHRTHSTPAAIYAARAREAADGAVAKQAMARWRALYFRACGPLYCGWCLGSYVFYLWVASSSHIRHLYLL